MDVSLKIPSQLLVLESEYNILSCKLTILEPSYKYKPFLFAHAIPISVLTTAPWKLTPKAMDLLEPIKDRINIPVATPSAYETGMRLLEFQENNPMSAVSNARRGSFLMGSGAGYNPFG